MSWQSMFLIKESCIGLSCIELSNGPLFYRGFKITMMIYKCNKELQTYTGIYKKKNKLNNKNDNFTFQMLF